MRFKFSVLQEQGTFIQNLPVNFEYLVLSQCMSLSRRLEGGGSVPSPTSCSPTSCILCGAHH